MSGQKPGSFRKLVRSLRLLNDKLEEGADEINVDDICPECGNKIIFTFLSIGMRQTKYTNCDGCGETLRMNRVV